MAKNIFKEHFNTVLRPALEDLGFLEVKLKGCMCPEFLFNNGRLWFSLSWDKKERYLEVSLGRLFRFKDVMERVVVIGDYSNYEKRITPDAIDEIGSDIKVLKIIASSLKDGIALYKTEYERIFQDFRVSRSKRGGINIDEYIGKELRIDDLDNFIA